MGGPLAGALDEPDEVLPGAEGVDGRDEQPPPGGDLEDRAEALERGARRLDEDRLHEAPEALADERFAVPLGLVEDDGGRRDPGGLEVGEDVLDQRHARDLEEGLGHVRAASAASPLRPR